MKAFLLISVIFGCANAFIRILPSNRQSKMISFQMADSNRNSETSSRPTNSFMNSRNQVKSVLSNSLTILASQMILFHGMKNNVANAATGPIVVFGSGGKTGKLIVEELLQKQVLVRPAYRNVNSAVTSTSTFMDAPVAADVTKLETLESAISGASSVIFAASASSKGGNGQQVDYQGVVNVAKECLRLKIPKLIVISAGAITRPDSLGFKITNLFGGLMGYKLQGENKLRELYEAGNDSKLSYVIIRPGGLLDGEVEGPSKIELNQGDSISGEISRADVADCVVAAALSSTIPSNVIFEMYEANKSGPLEGKFKGKSGYEQRGDNYDVMFKGLKSGVVTI